MVTVIHGNYLKLLKHGNLLNLEYFMLFVTKMAGIRLKMDVYDLQIAATASKIRLNSREFKKARK